MLFYPLTKADRVIIDQDVDGTVLLRDLRPQLICAFDVSQVSPVEMHALEVRIASQSFDILEELCL